MRLRFAVPERYLGRIGTGDRVTATVDPYPNEKFEGTITGQICGVPNPFEHTGVSESARW